VGSRTRPRLLISGRRPPRTPPSPCARATASWSPATSTLRRGPTATARVRFSARTASSYGCDH